MMSINPSVSGSRAIPQMAFVNEAPENTDESTYAIVGSQSAPTRMPGGRIIFPLDRRARIKSASVMSAPAPRTKAFVDVRTTEENGMKKRTATTIVAISATMLMVSNERRVPLGA